MADNPREREIQLAICDYLALKKHFFWRQNTTPIWDSKNGLFRAMPKYSMKGVADIIVIGKGGFVVFIEVKRKNGKLSEYQELFKAQCAKVGAVYLVATSLDDVINCGL